MQFCDSMNKGVSQVVPVVEFVYVVFTRMPGELLQVTQVFVVVFV